MQILPDMMTRRLVQLCAGLILYGLSIALMLRADLGLAPWDVLQEGLSEHTGLSFGSIIIIVGAVLLLLWIPLRQRPGIGTISNIVLIGLAADTFLWLLPKSSSLLLSSTMLLTGVALNGVATGAYIGSGLGPGPRDGLMTGIVGRTGWPIRTVRTSIELTVLGIGWLLGGSVGLGTVTYAVAIGPIIHIMLPLMAVQTETACKPA
jgi:uncharacterized membrane protein YczE